MLQDLLGYKDDIKNDADALKAALDDPDKRLGDLGPPPAEGEPPESADIAKLRKNLTDQVTRLTGLSKQADLSLADIDRLVGRIRGLQGARSFSRYTTRGMSPWSSELWTAAAADIPVASDNLTKHVEDWWRDQRASLKWVADLALIAAAIAGAIALLLLPRWSRWRHTVSTFDDKASPSTLDKRRRVAVRALSRGFLVAIAGALLYVAAWETGLVSKTGTQLALRIWFGAVVFVLIWNYARCVFSPRHPEWRVVRVGSKDAGVLRMLSVAIIGLFVIDRILAGGFEQGGAGIELTLAQAVLTNTLFSALLWFFLSPRLWRSAAPAPSATDAADGTPGAVASGSLHALRSAGRLLAIVIPVATALAYVRLANFVFHPSSCWRSS